MIALLISLKSILQSNMEQCCQFMPAIDISTLKSTCKIYEVYHLYLRPGISKSKNPTLSVCQIKKINLLIISLKCRLHLEVFE